MVGSLAPDFTLNDELGQSHRLSDYRGQDVVVYFYPKDDTPGCTIEACSIRDRYSLFAERNIVVFGVSYDGARSHQKFKEKHELPFILLSDKDKSVAAEYKSKGLFMPKRKTFLIDKQGVIIKVFESVNVREHADDILKDFEDHYSRMKP
ncbi:peroxiredoxin [bacterium]|nr:peroxiredoxin [bacterium]